jgi:hypothetical protein
MATRALINLPHLPTMEVSGKKVSNRMSKREKGLHLKTQFSIVKTMKCVDVEVL